MIFLRYDDKTGKIVFKESDDVSELNEISKLYSPKIFVEKGYFWFIYSSKEDAIKKTFGAYEGNAISD